jgi:hypothetical protein
MSVFSPFPAPAIIADIPPPIIPHSAASAVFLLIFCLLCGGAFVGLQKLFQRRSKKSLPRPEDVTKG